MGAIITSSHFNRKTRYTDGIDLSFLSSRDLRNHIKNMPRWSTTPYCSWKRKRRVHRISFIGKLFTMIKQTCSKIAFLDSGQQASCLRGVNNLLPPTSARSGAMKSEKRRQRLSVSMFVCVRLLFEKETRDRVTPRAHAETKTLIMQRFIETVQLQSTSQKSGLI